jgi:hypothetical protein
MNLGGYYALFESRSPEAWPPPNVAFKIVAPVFFDSGSSDTWKGQFAQRKKPGNPTSSWRQVNCSAARMTIIPMVSDDAPPFHGLDGS